MFWYVLFYKNLTVLHHVDNNFLFYFDICIKFTLSTRVIQFWSEVHFLESNLLGSQLQVLLCHDNVIIWLWRIFISPVTDRLQPSNLNNRYEFGNNPTGPYTKCSWRRYYAIMWLWKPLVSLMDSLQSLYLDCGYTYILYSLSDTGEVITTWSCNFDSYPYSKLLIG